MKKLLIITVFTMFTSLGSNAQEPIKVGIIGLDTSHSTAFTQMLNGNGGDTLTAQFRIVAAYPYGSTTIKSSMDRIPDYIEVMKRHGVEVTSSIAALLEKVDCVLLETNDGQIHLEQAAEVFRAGKICFIDKPLGATLAQAIAIYELAEYYGVPFFTSSALRYSTRNQELRRGEYGKILGADCYSPHYVEPTHPDFGWYGIHGIETLYTVMGVGCKAVNRMSGQSADIVIGEWKDGRIGTFRGIKEGPAIYGGQAFIAKEAIAVGGYEGYKVLLDAILNFFLIKDIPVSQEETLEIFAFMEASNMSRERNGEIVTLDEVMRKGKKDARKLLNAYKKR